MKNILFTSQISHGHFIPLMGIAKELFDRGYHVGFHLDIEDISNAKSYRYTREIVTRSGIKYLPVFVGHNVRTNGP